MSHILYDLLSVLEESIPNLRMFMEGTTKADIGDVKTATDLKQRWKFLLSKLVSAISKESHPIAILFEDIHWADKDALGELW